MGLDPSPNLPALLFKSFTERLRQNSDLRAFLRTDMVGKDTMFPTPFGFQKLLYADYVASGRSLWVVENFVTEFILPLYANTHTKTSFCGSYITEFREQGRAIIARECGAEDAKLYEVIFSGSGATAGFNRLVNLFGVDSGARVIHGPYEHHSNILPWRKAGAETIEISEAPFAPYGPDLDEIERELCRAKRDGKRPVLTFTAASNVTGVLTDVVAVSRLAKAHDAIMIWDYACAAPYMPMSMTPAPDVRIDAIVISTHKFVGGPQASGVTIVRKDRVVTNVPTWPGGGTVDWVNNKTQDYTSSLAEREEAGTPNIIGDIRAALAFLVRGVTDPSRMLHDNINLTGSAMIQLYNTPNLYLLGPPPEFTARLPILSFLVGDGFGGYLHQVHVTRMLSERFGIQSRGGCACAGPYGHTLLGVDDNLSQAIRDEIREGNELAKPGFTRLNLSVLMTREEREYILQAIRAVAMYGNAWLAEGGTDGAAARDIKWNWTRRQQRDVGFSY